MSIVFLHNYLHTLVHKHYIKCLSRTLKAISLPSLGGRYVKVWDLLKGGQPLVSLKNHHKTVTCLCLSSSGERLLSASLDRYGNRSYTYTLICQSLLHEADLIQSLCLSFRHVKVYNTTNYKVVHNFDYAASILSLALAVRTHI